MLSRRTLRFLAPFAALAILQGVTTTAAAATHVRSGQSIQAAIDAAAPGDTIVVERGTYRENLVVTRSVRLLSRGAVLTQPGSTGLNPCGFGQAAAPVVGICVIGQVSPDFVVSQTVDDVSITGFTIRGFSGDGVLALGASGFRAVRNVVANNGGYGIFANSSSDIELLYNTTYGNHEAGLYVGDSPTANAAVIGNSSYNNVGEGILIRDALGGRLVRNHLYGNCAGIFVLNTGAPGLSGNMSVLLNEVTANNRLCPGEEGEAPPFGGIGIALLGAQNTTVLLNLVRNNDAQANSALPGGGIVLFDTTAFGGGTPTGNTVQRNVLSGNDANDINGDGSGTGNTISGNTCTNTNVVGAC